VSASVFTLLSVVAIAVAIVVSRPYGTVGRRVAVLVAAGLLPLPYLASTFPLMASLTVTVVFLILDLALATLVWLVAIASWRRRVRRVSRAGNRQARHTVTPLTGAARGNFA
jgi:hypothetical protein